MIIVTTVNASSGLEGIALHRTVLTPACAACIYCVRAAACDVPITLTFCAANGFLLVLPNGDALVINAEAITQKGVGCAGLSNLEKGERLTLLG